MTFVFRTYIVSWVSIFAVGGSRVRTRLERVRVSDGKGIGGRCVTSTTREQLEEEFKAIALAKEWYPCLQ